MIIKPSDELDLFGLRLDRSAFITHEIENELGFLIRFNKILIPVVFFNRIQSKNVSARNNGVIVGNKDNPCQVRKIKRLITVTFDPVIILRVKIRFVSERRIKK